jgi:hypothetical protein
MSGLLQSYLRGLQILKQKVAKDQNDYQIIGMLQMRLEENNEKMRIQGDTRDIYGDRMEILSTANEITERLFAMSFRDFCQLHAPKASPQAGEQLSLLLTPAEREELKAALLSAFPSPRDLQQVAHKLGENLSVIAGGNNYDEVVSNLIRWAQSQAKIEPLLVRARQTNPGNSRLRLFEAQYNTRHAMPNPGGESELQQSDATVSSSSSPFRTIAFISHAQRDEKYLKQLHTQLDHYIREYGIRVWDTSKILPGAKRQQEIENALRATKVAVLLISPDFLASDVIAREEVQPLLSAAENEGVIIIPVILRPCSFDRSSIAQYTPINDPSTPLSTMTAGRREAIWVQVAEQLRELLPDAR